MFADDISIVVTNSSSESMSHHESQVSQTVDYVVEWLENNNLKPNMEKTNFINFNNVQHQLEILHNGNRLKQNDVTNFLGILVDSHLNWSEQINNVCKKVNRFVYVLRRLRKTTDQKTAIAAYYGYIESVLRYGLIIWGNGGDIHRAFTAQKKCIRAICGVGPFQSCKPLFLKLGILPLPCLYIFEVSKFVKQHSNLFKTATEIYPRNTRNGDRLVVDKQQKTARFRKNCSVMCVNVYNKLPQQFKDLSWRMFKKSLHEWLLDRRFYKTNDFLEYG